MLELLASAILLSQAVGPGYVPPPKPSSPYYVCLNDRNSFLNIRSKATIKSRSLGKLRYGETLYVIDRFLSTDGMYWAKVRTTVGIGYVRDDYVCVR